MAAFGIRMPKLGMTMQEGLVVAWPIAVGKRVEKGQVVLVIESEKSEAEIEAVASGYLRHTYAQPGERLPCAALLGAISESLDERFDALAFAAQEGGPVAGARAAPGAAPARAERAAPSAASAGRVGKPIAPAARALAKQLGIDALAVPGTGPGGRVTRQDIEAFAALRESRIEVAAGVALEVLREGEGEPVCFLPGFGVDASSFALQLRALSARCAVIAINPRGVGLSDAPALPCYAVEQTAADAAAVLSRAARGPAHVVGASLGAAAALELALAHPERVRSLTLITPFVSASARLHAVVQAWCEVAALASPERLARVLAPWLFGDALLGDDAARERTLRGLAASVSRVPVSTLERAAAGLRAWSGTRGAALRGLGVPTLVLCAGGDLLTPGGEFLAGEIPGARCVVVPGAGHALAVEAGERVTEALLGFLAGAPPA